ncbi:MAG: hypothetical protein PHT88_04190 [Candidatus Moranbacteria bacterium]|nr:hypothetical protein [Candidatus Moranbacteria bacterium]
MEEKKSVLKGVMYWARVVTLGIIFGLGLQFASAWTNPTAPAPGGNIGGPINTSAFAQYKSGALGIGGLLKAYTGIDTGKYDGSGNLVGQNKITNVGTPVNGTDAVNKDYVDAASGSGGGNIQCTSGSTGPLISCVNTVTGRVCLSSSLQNWNCINLTGFSM